MSMRKRSWKEFQDTGLLWFINSILHMFGWSIVIIEDKGEIIEVCPARVDFRGFPEKSNSNGYRKVSKYLQENIDDIVKEAFEEV